MWYNVNRWVDMLKTLIVEISQYNNGDSIDEFMSHTGLNIVREYKLFNGKKDEAYLITDSRDTANEAKRDGIGFAVYINELSSSESFTDALYCVDRIDDTEDYAINRMYQRFMGIPWTILETERFTVREITVEDVDSLYKIYSDLETKKYIEDLYSDREREIEFTKDYIANQYRFFEYGNWVVIDRKTGELIGRAGLSDRIGFENIELGFVFNKEYWGKSAAYEVCSAILEYARDNLRQEKVIAFTMDDNKRAIRFLEKLGFIFEGYAEINLGTFRKYTNML